MSQELADAVRAVLDAAEALVSGVQEGKDPIPLDNDLIDAVCALGAIRESLSRPVEGQCPWRDVMAQDEVQGKNGEWYRVVGVYGTGTPRPGAGPIDSGNAVVVEILINGQPKRYRKPATELVLTRRAGTPERDVITILENAGFDIACLWSK